MSKGFKGPKMGGLGGGQQGMMQQIQRLQEQMEQAQAKLAEETVTATVGGGAVKITVTGDQKCKAIQIDPAILQDADVEMLQDMILTAFNQAQDKATALASERLNPLAGSIPGLPF
ncbi:MAG: YbaB/EbfC family nucleoid-associated protein [Chloroflexota bacterium]